MRLVDADVIREKIPRGESLNEYDVRTVIDSQPTAVNVDKIYCDNRIKLSKYIVEVVELCDSHFQQRPPVIVFESDSYDECVKYKSLWDSDNHGWEVSTIKELTLTYKKV